MRARTQSAEMKYTKSYTYTHSYVFMMWRSIKYRKNDASVQPPFDAQGYTKYVFN